MYTSQITPANGRPASGAVSLKHPASRSYPTSAPIPVKSHSRVPAQVYSIHTYHFCVVMMSTQSQNATNPLPAPTRLPNTCASNTISHRLLQVAAAPANANAETTTNLLPSLPPPTHTHHPYLPRVQTTTARASSTHSNSNRTLHTSPWMTVSTGYPYPPR